MARKNLTAYLEGADELDAALKALSDRAGGFLLKDAAQAGAEVIRAEAERNAPRDTGLLAESEIAQPTRLQVGRAQFAIGPSKAAWYGTLLEVGTRKMPAHPFLRPAFDTKKLEALQAFSSYLRKHLLKQ